MTFVYDDRGRPDHLSGYHDDLIIALAIGIFTRAINMRMFSAGFETQKSILENLSFNNNVYEFSIFRDEKDKKRTNEQYNMRVGNANEDLKWLL